MALIVANGFGTTPLGGGCTQYVQGTMTTVFAIAPASGLLAAKPPSFKRVRQIGSFKPALEDAEHPDHRLALLLKGADMIRLPLLGPAAHVKLLTAGLSAADLDRVATPADAAIIAEHNRRLAWESESKTLDPAVVMAGVAAAIADPVRKGPYYLACEGTSVIGQCQVTFEWSDWRNGWLWWIQGVYVPADYRRHGAFRALYEHVRREAGMSTAVVGMITEPAHAEAILQDGKADIIAIAREMLCNPYWPAHAAKALGLPDWLDVLPENYAFRLYPREDELRRQQEGPPHEIPFRRKA